MSSGRNPVVPIAVPGQLKKPHPLVAELKAAARAAQEDKGVLALNYSKVLRVRTSSRCLGRALALMDVLIKGFESRGYKVKVGERAETRLLLQEGVLSFRLDERTKRVAPPPPPVPPKFGRPAPFGEPWRPAFMLVPTGEFTLAFERFRIQSCRNSWRDRAGLSLESQLHEVLEAVPSWEAALKARRFEKEDRERRAKEAEARRVAIAREQERLRRQRASLTKHLIAWEQAERLRLFIAAVKKSRSPNRETATWLDWANAQVLALDPVRTEALTNLDVQLEDSFAGHPTWDEPANDWWNT